MTAGERVFIGLGANLGDARATLAQALRDIAALPGTELVKASACYRSAPVDAEGPDFVNAVAEVRTMLDPQVLLEALQHIEQRHGRERPYPNAPRTLDLDLLLYGQRLLKSATLTVPHPRMAQRVFVLQPLADLAPGLRHPVLGDIAKLARQMADRADQADQVIEKLA